MMRNSDKTLLNENGATNVLHRDCYTIVFFFVTRLKPVKLVRIASETPFERPETENPQKLLQPPTSPRLDTIHTL